MKREFDLAVVGSGFGGSLLAMIGQRLGLRVLLLEKGRHPRFAIGESSTPLANLLLEELALRYDLPRLLPFCKWGTWQREYPHVGCGLKRGFSFLHHTQGESFSGRRRDGLLVAASPHDAIADTHWFRPDFDAFFVDEAVRCGVEYIDEIALEPPQFDDGVTLSGTRNGAKQQFKARFLVDASGPRGFLHRALNLGEEALPAMPPTQALYSHFENVQRLDKMGVFDSEATPYPADDAALHHVFEGGWMWVLRFKNGLTSAGIAAHDDLAKELNLAEGEAAWARILARFPTVSAQFEKARAVRPFVQAPKIAFCSDRIAGENWALLPSAAGFIDPLLSTGFPLTLLGIVRLSEIFEHAWKSPDFASQLQNYATQTRNEIHITSKMVGALYRNMDDFEKFSSLTLLYFAAASYSETARRLNRPQLAKGFLLHDHPTFGPALRLCLENGVSHAQILQAIEPIDVAGLSRTDRNNWYPVDADDLRRAASKVEASVEEIDALLKKCGFAA